MNRRDEVKEKIRQGLFCKPGRVVGDSEAILADLMSELDSLVEQWTDEETAEDLDKSIEKSEVYEGMRVRLVNPNDGSPPRGITGEIVHPDVDGIPAVLWDNPEWNTCLRPHNKGSQCRHAHVEELEKE